MACPDPHAAAVEAQPHRDLLPGGRQPRVQVEGSASRPQPQEPLHQCLPDAPEGSQVEPASVNVTVDVSRALSGRVGKVLVNAASDLEAGLIVLGCRGRSELTSLLLGSVAHDVLQHSHCPVLIAR